MHVYHVEASSAGSGVTEKNAASTLGERTFMFDGGARGLTQYYANGIIELVWTSYTQLGPYAHCNHAAGSSVYNCDNTSPYIGKEDNSHSGGAWYSFNKLGENKHWHQGDCPSVRQPAKTVVDKLAAAGGCSGCPSAGCAQCIRRIADAKYKQVWDAQFGNPKDLEVLNASGAVEV